MVDAVEMGDEDGTTLAEYLKNIGTGFSDIYVTPEQFGAKGNGIDDDSPALFKGTGNKQTCDAKTGSLFEIKDPGHR